LAPEIALHELTGLPDPLLDAGQHHHAVGCGHVVDLGPRDREGERDESRRQRDDEQGTHQLEQAQGFTHEPVPAEGDDVEPARRFSGLL